MSASGIRRFDLYDFFSVLLPGLAFLIGLYPILPESTRISSIGAILPLLAGGFVIGRAIHSAAVRIYDWFDVDSHRDVFLSELRNPVIMNRSTVDEFYERARTVFPYIGLSEFRVTCNEDRQARETLYAAVRGEIHIDSRGRSRTFQAVFAFYRSIWVVSFMLAVVYLLYALASVVAQFTGSTANGPLPYSSKIYTLEVPPSVLIGVALVDVLLSRQTFRYAMVNYKRYFIQYLMTDFMSLDGGSNKDSD